MPPSYLFDALPAYRAASRMEWMRHRHFRGLGQSGIFKESERAR